MNYKSRAAFKLLEIQNKFKIIKKGQKVIDIGSAPGGWSQVISEIIQSNKTNPSVIAVDILRMDPIDGVSFVQGDLTRKEIQEKILEKNNFEKFDVVLSDMCPEFVGQKYKDHFNLIKLNEMTIEFGSKILKTNGILVMKTFEGTMQKKLQENIELYFEKIQRFKPASSRSESSEIYLICFGYMQNQKLKSEIERIENTDINEFIDKKKNDAIKNYKFKKYDTEFDKEKLNKLREDIIKIFKLDPEEIKITKDEEEEIKKIMENEKKEVIFKKNFNEIEDKKHVKQNNTIFNNSILNKEVLINNNINKNKETLNKLENITKEKIVKNILKEKPINTDKGKNHNSKDKNKKK